jgi:hypothetical protein
MVVTETAPETVPRHSGHPLPVIVGLIIAGSTFVGIGFLADPGPMREQQMTGSSQPLQVISAWVESYNSGDVDAWLALYAEDAVVNGTLLKLDPEYIRGVQLMNISWHETLSLSECTAVDLDVFHCHYLRSNDMLARGGITASGLIEFGFDESGSMLRSDPTVINPEVTVFESALSSWIEAEHPEIALATRFGQMLIGDASADLLAVVEEFVEQSDVYPLTG